MSYPHVPPACCVVFELWYSVTHSRKADWISTQHAFCMTILNDITVQIQAAIWSECETLQFLKKKILFYKYLGIDNIISSVLNNVSTFSYTLGLKLLKKFGLNLKHSKGSVFFFLFVFFFFVCLFLS